MGCPLPVVPPPRPSTLSAYRPGLSIRLLRCRDGVDQAGADQVVMGWEPHAVMVLAPGAAREGGIDAVLDHLPGDGGVDRFLPRLVTERPHARRMEPHLRARAHG